MAGSAADGSRNAGLRGELQWLSLLLLAALVTSLWNAHWLIWVVELAVGAVPPALLWSRAGEAVAAAAHEVLSDRIVRAVVALLVAFAFLLAGVFSAAAAVFAVAAFLALAGVVAALRGAAALRGLLLGSAASAVVVTALAGAAELAFHHPALQHRWGLPFEHEIWQERHLEISQRNLFGFRSPYETVRRPPGTLRVVALGDSFTWGDWVADDAAIWPARLERKLASASDRYDVEVVNMARPGFTTGNEAERLRRIGWQFEPSLVVVQYLVNDALPSRAHGGVQTWRRDQLYPQHWLLPVRFRSGAIAESSLFRFIESRYSLMRSGPVVPRYEALYEPGEPGWRETQAAFAEMARGGRERDVPVLLVLFPLFAPGEWTAEDHPLVHIHEKVLAAARSAGLRTFDLTPAYAARGGNWRRWWATPFDAHPNPEAHEIAADALAAELAASDWFAALASQVRAEASHTRGEASHTRGEAAPTRGEAAPDRDEAEPGGGTG